MIHAVALDRLRLIVTSRRREIGLSQGELAKAAGLSKPTISRIEQGKVPTLPKLSSIERLAKGLQMPFDDLKAILTRGGGHRARAKHRVLVVEPDTSLAALICQGLGDPGLAVVPAHDGERALEIFHYATPDHILLELDLPSIDGLHLLSHLRRDLDYRGRVIVMTNRPEKVLDEFRVSGADVVVSKSDNRFGIKHFRDILSGAEAGLHGGENWT